MSAYWFICGVIWLILGLADLRIGIQHAKKYEYSPPILTAAWYWLTVAVLAFAVSILSIFFA